MNILVAGVGNIFLGDDAFGVEVVRALAARELPPGVRVRDFGIRGIDLAYELQEELDVAIIVDAARRGGAAGSLYVIEPEAGWERAESAAAGFSPHGMTPEVVLEWIGRSAAVRPRAVLVCCEPESFGTETLEQGRMGLSEPVRAAVPRAVERIESLLNELLDTRGEAHVRTKAH